MVEVLLKLNDSGENVVDVNAVDDFGSTALAAAAEEGHAAIVQMLIRAGADHSLADGDGDTALKLSIDNGHSEVVALLQEL